MALENAAPVLVGRATERAELTSDRDDSVPDPIDAREIFDIRAGVMRFILFWYNSVFSFFLNEWVD